VPLFTYRCSKCRSEVERLLGYEDRDTPRCPDCKTKLSRAGVEAFAIGKPAHQMGVVLSDGSRIKGQFAKEARRRRRRKTA